MSAPDSGIRYWAVVGLHLLDQDAAPALKTLQQGLSDEEDEVKLMAAWTLVKLGRTEEGLACLRNLLFSKTTARRELLNLLDWMDAAAVPLVREYLQANPKEDRDILGKIAQDHGIEVPK